MKKIVQALDKEGACFHYLCKSFPSLSNKKLKAGLFYWPQIEKPVNDQQFIDNQWERCLVFFWYYH